MPATAPSGVGINEYYKSEEEYLHALAVELNKEYRAIVAAGILLQVDDPFVPDIFFDPGLDDRQKQRRAQIYVEATNAALGDIPAERVRFHTCYGINEGPRLYEASLDQIIDYVFKINAGSFSFEAANPRHEHEYHLFERVKVPEGKVLCPGVITHASNIVEHPELIAERLIRFVNRAAGRDRACRAWRHRPRHAARRHPRLRAAALPHPRRGRHRRVEDGRCGEQRICQSLIFVGLGAAPCIRLPAPSPRKDGRRVKHSAPATPVPVLHGVRVRGNANLQYLEATSMTAKPSLPATMAAVLLTGHGGPEKLVYRTDVKVPSPAPGEVLVKVTACGMNNTDVWVRQGAYGTEEDAAAVSTWRRQGNTLTFPRIQGTDTVGNIVAVGEGVSSARIGERVMVDFSIYNRDDDLLADIDYMGHGRDGGYAEYQTVPAENAHVVATDLTDVELATFCCAYLTGEQMLERAALKASERMLVTGASGGVGSGIVQLARARGAIPYAVVGKGKEQAVLDIGAEAVITRGVADLPAAVNNATGGQPIDVVADLVGGAIFNDLLRILRPEGRYTTAGAIAGPVVQLDLRTMYLKQLQLHGSSQGTRHDFRRIVRYIEDKKIRPLVGGVYKLSDFHRAQADFIAKDFVGKLVVVPDAVADLAATR